MKKAYHLIIKGKVQNVSYRLSAYKKALEYEICGWVKNTDNGNVEAIIEGEEIALAKLLNWCYEGPIFAKVTEIEKTEAPIQNFTEFKIDNL